MLFSIGAQAQSASQVIALDKETMSGFNLKPIKLPWAAEDRELKTANLFIGENLVNYVLSSNTATHFWEDFPLDELIYVINGQAVITLEDGTVQKFQKGEFFMIPKGFKGHFETAGGPNFFLGMAIVARKRTTKTVTRNNKTPLQINQESLSGIGLDQDQEKVIIVKGMELTVSINALSNHTEIIEDNDTDIFIKVFIWKSYNLPSKWGSKNILYRRVLHNS